MCLLRSSDFIFSLPSSLSSFIHNQGPTLTYDEVEKALNDCHFGACGGHISGYTTSQKILRGGFFWPSLLRIALLSSRNDMLVKIVTIRSDITLLLFIL
jgi:hypothetical protein